MSQVREENIVTEFKVIVDMRVYKNILFLVYKNILFLLLSLCVCVCVSSVCVRACRSECSEKTKAVNKIDKV